MSLCFVRCNLHVWIKIVDLKKLRDPKDIISCDDMGSWCFNGTHPSLC